MSSMKVGRLFHASLLLVCAIALSACGFHLRENVKLPASIRKIHIVTGVGDFQRMLARALEVAGVDVTDEGGPGIAELRVPVANFSTDTLTAGGYARITEYAVRYNVSFSVIDGVGNVVVPPQNISMQREYSYDATNTIGNASEVSEIQQSLNEDMVQAILFRLQAAGKHPVAPPVAAPAPATAASAAASSAR
ncbi:LPS-assembly lipoprotein LptE [Rhodanobacter sp. BL-MT-08]